MGGAARPLSFWSRAAIATAETDPHLSRRLCPDGIEVSGGLPSAIVPTQPPHSAEGFLAAPASCGCAWKSVPSSHMPGGDAGHYDVGCFEQRDSGLTPGRYQSGEIDRPGAIHQGRRCPCTERRPTAFDLEERVGSSNAAR